MATKGAGNKIALGLVGASIATALAASWLSVEDVGESIALRLLEMLPRKRGGGGLTFDAFHENGTAAADQIQAYVGAGKESTFRRPGRYDAKEAMEERYAALRERCAVYGDFMRPERHLTTAVTTAAEAVLYDPRNDLALCTLPGAARGSLEALFGRLRDVNTGSDVKRSRFELLFPATMGGVRRAIMVRHPLERLVSAYRNVTSSSNDLLNPRSIKNSDINSYTMIDGYVWEKVKLEGQWP